MKLTTEEIIYPSSDGQPMADSTIQYQWITKIQGGCDALLLSIGEAAAVKGVSTDTLRRWEKEGKIRSVPTQGGHRR